MCTDEVIPKSDSEKKNNRTLKPNRLHIYLNIYASSSNLIADSDEELRVLKLYPNTNAALPMRPTHTNMLKSRE